MSSAVWIAALNHKILDDTMEESAIEISLLCQLQEVVIYLVFKIVAHLVKGLVTAVIAAILAFLISTVPGNLLLSSAFDRIQQEVTTHLPSDIKDQLG